MAARFTFILALLFALAGAPVRPALACVVGPAVSECASCCEAADAACCASTSSPAESTPLAPAPSLEGKLLAPPIVRSLGLCPLPAMVPPVAQRLRAVGLPVIPLLERHCILLV